MSLTLDSINQLVRNLEYAVRGLIPTKAREIEDSLRAEGKPSDMIMCNIGNPQALKQRPITFFHKVLALMEDPDLLANPPSHYNSDMVDRAKQLLSYFDNAPGAYTDSAGARGIRREVADFITARDQHPCDFNSLFLSDGASPAIKYVLSLVIRERRDGMKETGIMTPVPQYPLYSASIQQFGGHFIGYNLNEEEDWGLDMDRIREAYTRGCDEGYTPRALILINPGNPTGQCLTEDNIYQVLHFCKERQLVVFSDEVYQTNVYVEGKQFISARKVLLDHPELHGLELFSFHSISKGFVGECGTRGGYLQAEFVSAPVMQILTKLVSVNLCPNTKGQCITAMMVRPPREGEPSYEMYIHETREIFGKLQRTAARLSVALNGLDRLSCRTIQGALYAFPRIEFPPAAIAAAREKNIRPDTLYCLDLLNDEHVCVVPGSGFAGDNHLRLTILPPEDQIDDLIARISRHHLRFMQKYSAQTQDN